ncbi:hypothetical protein VPH35_056450 [Triticum aestivum]
MDGGGWRSGVVPKGWCTGVHHLPSSRTGRWWQRPRTSFPPCRLRRGAHFPFGFGSITYSWIPNTLSVLSNTTFLFVGLAWLILCHYTNYFRLCSEGERLSWTLLCWCHFWRVGSSYYHLYANDATFVWDKLPVTLTYGLVCLDDVAFTSIVAIFNIKRVDDRSGTKSLAPLVIAGALSIMYWSFFDDLRPYAVIQFMPCIVIPVMTIVIPPMYTHSSYWLWAVGYTLKHLCAAMLPVFFTLMLAKRTIEPDRVTLLKMWKISWRERGSKDSNTVDVKYDYAAVSTMSEQQ